MLNRAFFGLSLVLACAGCSAVKSADVDVPEPTRMDVAVSRSLATRMPFAMDINPQERESLPFSHGRQWVAPGCYLQFLSLPPRDDVNAPLRAFLDDGPGSTAGYLNTYRRYILRSTFAQDQSALPNPLRADLNSFARALHAITAVTPHVIVVGHTNPEGTGQYNDRLATERARNAAAYLEAQGVPRDRVHIVTAGESMPPQNVHPAAERDRSRRVELVTFVPGAARPAPDTCDRDNDKRLVSATSGGLL